MKSTVRLALDIELATEQALLREAEKRHTTVSELVRQAVDAYLAACRSQRGRDGAESPARAPSLAEKMSHLRFSGDAPNDVAENHDEYLYPLTGPAKQK